MLGEATHSGGPGKKTRCLGSSICVTNLCFLIGGHDDKGADELIGGRGGHQGDGGRGGRGGRVRSLRDLPLINVCADGRAHCT